MPEGSIVEGALFSVIIVTIVILLFIWSDSHPHREHFQPNNFNATQNEPNIFNATTSLTNLTH